jgi:hypothetical protein
MGRRGEIEIKVGSNNLENESTNEFKLDVIFLYC